MKSQSMLLSDVDLDKEVRVVNIMAEGELRRRFFDLGIINDTVIEPLYTSPFGDPKAYLIRGTIIAIRKEEAKKIQVLTLASNFQEEAARDYTCF